MHQVPSDPRLHHLLTTRGIEAPFRLQAANAFFIVPQRDLRFFTGVVTFGFQVEMTERERSLGAVIREVPITFDERIAGESKLDSSIFVEELAMVTKGGLSRLAQAARSALGARR